MVCNPHHGLWHTERNLTVFCNSTNPSPFTPPGSGEKPGIIPACIWQDANWFKNEKAFSCGLVDGFYINVADKVGNITQVVTCLTELANSAINPDADMKACRAIGEQLYAPIKMIYGVMTSDETRTTVWNGMKAEAKKFGNILTCTGTYSEEKLCRYMQGRLVGDFVADYATGGVAGKLLEGTKKAMKMANFTKALATVEKVESGFTQMSNSVSKLKTAGLKKVKTATGTAAKLLLDNGVELLEYVGKTIKVPTGRWKIPGSTGWELVTTITGDYINETGEKIKNGAIKIYKKNCASGGRLAAGARVDATNTICEHCVEAISSFGKYVKQSSKKFPLCKDETRQNPALKWLCDARDKAEAYQKRITGSTTADLSFDVDCDLPPCKSGSVSFDGFNQTGPDAGTLIDAKYGYGDSWFYTKKDGTFTVKKKKEFFDTTVEEAKRQCQAIKDKPGLKIEWHISTATGAAAMQQFFATEPELFSMLNNGRFKIINTP